MKRIGIVMILVATAFISGYLLRGGGPDAPVSSEQHDHGGQEAKKQIWTCSMHPQIRMPQPGQCPICGMDLIPVADNKEGDENERELKLSKAAVKLAEIQTSPVERKFAPVEIRMVGKVDYDETRLANIAAWVPGRLDRLYVDYTGVSVRKGDHLVYIYSPDLLTAQEELIQARGALRELKQSGMKIMRDTARQTISAAREKLRLWGLTENQIINIERQGKASDHLTIYAPTSGIVIEKHVDQGAYVKTGALLYTIADLSQVWIKLDAYESDLIWLRYGLPVQIETEAYPGDQFKGTIAFIDPVLNTKTRTVKVRVNVSNGDGRLKPGMFVHTIVSSRVSESGRVIDAALAGKWMCPMHPEIIKEQAGSCDICGMPLARTETLGYVGAGSDEKNIAPLVIPASAPLITGRRAVVYVARPEEEGRFEGREITLGPRAGNYYIVKQGLEEGEQVVVNGNFKIDSALQILAKPSMMSPEGGVAPSGQAGHGDAVMTEKEAAGTEKKVEETWKTPMAFRKQIDGVLTVYFRIQEALSQDNAGGVIKETANLQKSLDAIDMALLDGPAHMAWMKDLKDLSTQAKVMAGDPDIKKQREAFYLFSASLISVVKRYGTSGDRAVIQFYCPMAFDNRGADWLQNKPGVENPYFGKMMFRCGEQRETLVEGN